MIKIYDHNDKGERYISERIRESKIARKVRRGGLTIKSRNGMAGEYFRKYKRQASN